MSGCRLELIVVWGLLCRVNWFVLVFLLFGSTIHTISGGLPLRRAVNLAQADDVAGSPSSKGRSPERAVGLRAAHDPVVDRWCTGLRDVGRGASASQGGDPSGAHSVGGAASPRRLSGSSPSASDAARPAASTPRWSLSAAPLASADDGAPGGGGHHHHLPPRSPPPRPRPCSAAARSSSQQPPQSPPSTSASGGSDQNGGGATPPRGSPGSRGSPSAASPAASPGASASGAKPERVRAAPPRPRQLAARFVSAAPLNGGAAGGPRARSDDHVGGLDGNHHRNNNHTNGRMNSNRVGRLKYSPDVGGRHVAHQRDDPSCPHDEVRSAPFFVSLLRPPLFPFLSSRGERRAAFLARARLLRRSFRPFFRRRRPHPTRDDDDNDDDDER